MSVNQAHHRIWIHSRRQWRRGEDECVPEIYVGVGTTVGERREGVGEGEERAAAGPDVERRIVCRGQRVRGHLELGVDLVHPASGCGGFPRRGGVFGRHAFGILDADLATVARGCRRLAPALGLRVGAGGEE